MKVKLGPAGSPTKVKGTIEGVRWLIENSLQAMEVQFVYGVRISKRTAKELGKIAKDKLELTCHAPYYVNLCNPLKQQKSIKRILLAAERAKAMNAKIVTFHPGFYGKLRKEKAFQLVKSCLEKLSEKMPSKVKLGPETTGKLSQFGTFDELLKISEEIDQCQPVVDFAHLYARNHGKIDYARIFDKLAELEHIHSHFTAVEYGKKGEKKHLTLAKGKPKFKPLAKEILKRKLDITIISESPILEQDSFRQKEIFEELGYKF